MNTKMNAWSKDEVQRIAVADDLHIAPLREDGVTYGTPTWIWSVAVDGELYEGRKLSWKWDRRQVRGRDWPGFSLPHLAGKMQEIA